MIVYPTVQQRTPPRARPPHPPATVRAITSSPRYIVPTQSLESSTTSQLLFRIFLIVTEFPIQRAGDLGLVVCGHLSLRYQSGQRVTWTDSNHIAVTVTCNDVKTGAGKPLAMISCFDETDSISSNAASNGRS